MRLFTKPGMTTQWLSENNVTNQALMLFEPDFLSTLIGRAVYPFFVHTVYVPLSSSYLNGFFKIF